MRVYKFFGTMILTCFVLAILLSLFGCAELETAAQEMSKTPTPTPTATPAGKLAWSNADWDKALYAAIDASTLAKSSIKDTADFCPSYKSLTTAQRREFWATFLVAMAKRESGYKPATTFKESFKNGKGEYVVSTGLFQLSYESASQTAYGCGKLTTEDLKDPLKNIQCATKIVSRWVSKDGYAAGKKGSNLGCGRYWSVCRSTSDSRAYIASQTKALKGCK